MSMDDLIALLLAMPIGLAAQWGVWFAVGLGLSMWGRREKLRAENYYEPEPEPVKATKAEERHARQQAKAPHSAGDAFGELEALLEPFAGSHRMPGEAAAPPAPGAPAAAPAAPQSPVLTEAPRLAAPQSLP
jgi:hypothetical protein